MAVSRDPLVPFRTLTTCGELAGRDDRSRLFFGMGRNSVTGKEMHA